MADYRACRTGATCRTTPSRQTRAGRRKNISTNGGKAERDAQLTMLAHTGTAPISRSQPGDEFSYQPAGSHCHARICYDGARQLVLGLSGFEK